MDLSYSVPEESIRRTCTALHTWIAFGTSDGLQCGSVCTIICCRASGGVQDTKVSSSSLCEKGAWQENLYSSGCIWLMLYASFVQSIYCLSLVYPSLSDSHALTNRKVRHHVWSYIVSLLWFLHLVLQHSLRISDHVSLETFWARLRAKFPRALFSWLFDWWLLLLLETVI